MHVNSGVHDNPGVHNYVNSGMHGNSGKGFIDKYFGVGCMAILWVTDDSGVHVNSRVHVNCDNC